MSDAAWSSAQAGSASLDTSADASAGSAARVLAVEKAAAEKDRAARKVVFATTLAGMLEWYDFAVYGFMATEIGNTFFSGTERQRLMGAYAVFAAAFIARPLGGLWFGHVGDSEDGPASSEKKVATSRGAALEQSIVIMAVPTLLLAILPGTSTIGVFAPLLLCFVRATQGLSVGGQLVGSIVLTAEEAPLESRHCYTALTFAGANAGSLVGAVVATFLHAVFGRAAMRRGAWRLAFAFGFLLSLVAYLLQRQLRTSTDSEAHATNSNGRDVSNATPRNSQDDAADAPLPDGARQDGAKQSPLRAVLATPRGRLHVAAVALVHTTGFYLTFLFLPSFYVEFLRVDAPVAFSLSVLSLLGLISGAPLVGKWADSQQPRSCDGCVDDDASQKMRLKSILYVARALVIAPPLCFWFAQRAALQTGAGRVCLLALAAAPLVLLQCLLDGVLCTWMVGLFPPRGRYSAMALGVNLATAVFGGVAPLCATALAAAAGPGFRWAAALYFTGVALASLVGVKIARDVSEAENARVTFPLRRASPRSTSSARFAPLHADDAPTVELTALSKPVRRLSEDDGYDDVALV
ncbi:major facilitator superfamily domain-containing protein [Pelagophyceae sp. CCMP2097]|nr:major facilitator superfamily domain-containing protein [Pelagophyceae sp. CCMP2097]